MSKFAKFNNKIDKEQLAKDIAEANENQGGTMELEEGNYEVEVEKIECKETKKGDPMISIWFNILDGNRKGCKIFFNQVLQVGSKNIGWQLSKGIRFVESLDSGIELKDNTDLEVIEAWLEEVFDEIQDKGLEYELKYSRDKKGYDVHEIVEVFEG